MLTAQHVFYPFGMPMPGRSLSLSNYRFGFNKGSEKANEPLGLGNLYTTLYRELDTRLANWWSIDPKPIASQSPYCSMDNNPIWNNDPLGDIVNTQGFSERKILRQLRKGLGANKENNPYYFDKGHNLQVDQSKAGKLSDKQKEVLNNIEGAIDNSIVFTIKKSQDSEIIPGGQGTNGKPITVYEAGGAATFPNLKGGVPDFTGSSGITIFWNGHGGINLEETNGNKLREPGYSVLYHELGGHGYLRYAAKIEQLSARGLTIDYENKVRELHRLPARRYDETHPNPMAPIKPITIKSVN